MGALVSSFQKLRPWFLNHTHTLTHTQQQHIVGPEISLVFGWREKKSKDVATFEGL